MSGANQSGSAAELARQVNRAWRWTQLKFAAAFVGIASLIGISAIATLRPGSPRTARTPLAKAIPQTAGNAGTPATAGRIIPVGASFHLQVVAADTGEAISGAKVLLTLYLEGPEESTSRDDLVTDSLGVCDVPLPEDNLLGVLVGVNRSGWENRYFNWLPEWQYPLPSAYVMKLGRAESIGGRVVDATHRPVVGVVVRASAWVGDLSGRQPDRDRELPRFPQSVFLGTTDAQGRWVCHTLSSAGPDVSFQFEHADYLPNSLLVDLAKDLVPLADLRARRLETVLQSGVLARGQVVNPAGEAISGARIAKSWEQPGVTTDTNGQFKFRSLSSGEVPLVATAKGFAPQHFTGVAGGNPVRIRLQVGGVLRVRVLTTELEPIMGARLALNDGFGDGALGWDARTDADGRVVWESAPPNQSLFF